MKNSAAALSILLLLSLQAAAYVAQFSPQAAKLSITDGAQYSGHYGDYTLYVGRAASNIFVKVEGPEESAAALQLEISWLSANGILSTSCAPSGISYVNSSEAYCGIQLNWSNCSSVSLCEKLPEAEIPAPMVSPAQNTAGGAAQNAQSASAPSPSAFGAERTLSSNQPAAQSSGITPEQALQLLGALFVVIIASYLLLQQKPPEITPQDQQLLSNETRAGILQELDAADKIPTDLSNKLGKSKATIVEHLDTLLSAGFVERIATPGKKYVFYRLTRKGKFAILKKAA